jgi:hypothetical protein
MWLVKDVSGFAGGKVPNFQQFYTNGVVGAVQLKALWIAFIIGPSWYAKSIAHVTDLIADITDRYFFTGRDQTEAQSAQYKAVSKSFILVHK